MWWTPISYFLTVFYQQKQHQFVCTINIKTNIGEAPKQSTPIVET